MWTTNKDDLNKDIKGGTMINKNGCYDCKITKAYIVSGINGSQSEGLNLSFENRDREKMFIFISYKDKNGCELDFNIKHLSHLEYLTKLTTEQIYNNRKSEQINNQSRITFPLLENKYIGVIVEVKAKEGGYEYLLKGFYDIKTKKSVAELSKNEEAKALNYWLDKFKDAEEVKPLPKKDEKKDNVHYNFANDVIDEYVNNAEENEEKINDEFPF